MKISIAIALIVISFLTLPLSLVPISAVVLYDWFKNRDFTYIINRLENISGMKLLIACGLTLASLLIIYQQTAYAT